VNKEPDSTGDFLIHVIIKQGELLMIILLSLLVELECIKLLKFLLLLLSLLTTQQSHLCS